MKVVYQVLDLFYSTFGITPPKKGDESRSLILLLLIIFGCAAFVVGGLAIVYLTRVAQ
jgi:hypothetical protein